MSDHFCILPWIHAHFYTNGDYRLCCMSGKRELLDEAGRQLSLRTHTLAEIWNSPALREVRRKMLAGEPVEDCRTCLREEALGGATYRLWAGQEWLVNHPESERYIELVKRSMSDDLRVDELPAYYDLRPGNQCNLACRSCCPDLSSRIEADPVHRAWFPPRSDPASDSRGDQPWYRDESILEGELLAQAEKVRKFYFAGGEPFLNPVVRKLIGLLIERGLAPRVKLQFSTNATIVDEPFLERLQAFERVDLYLSIDGVGELYEYLRHPGRWADTLANLERLAKMSWLRCTAIPTVQNYNALGIPRLLELIESLGFGHSLNLLYNPHLLDVRVMPAAARREARARLLAYLERSPRMAKPCGARARVQLLLRELEQELPQEEYRASMEEFLRFTRDLDRARGQSFEASCPELHAQIVAEGFAWPPRAEDEHRASARGHLRIPGPRVLAASRAGAEPGLSFHEGMAPVP